MTSLFFLGSCGGEPKTGDQVAAHANPLGTAAGSTSGAVPRIATGAKRAYRLIQAYESRGSSPVKKPATSA